MKTTSEQTTQKHSQVKPWWDSPLWGDNSFREIIITLFKREPIPESPVFLHDRALMALEKFAPYIQGLDNDKFGNPEFLLLLKIKSSFINGRGEYAGLSEPNSMVHAALGAKDSFLKIEQVEFQCRGFKQQHYYEAIFNLLQQNLTKSAFEKEAQVFAQDTIQQLKTTEGIEAIRSYSQELKRLSSEHELGLRLLYLFKKNELTDFSILQKISDLVTQFKKEELHDPKQISVQVKLNYNLFEKLGKIIGVTGKLNNPDTYTKIIQHIALTEKYQDSYSQFQRLLGFINQWEEPYTTLQTIREEYSAKVYKQPKTFRRKPPGIEIYTKYEPWLNLTPEQDKVQKRKRNSQRSSTQIESSYQ